MELLHSIEKRSSHGRLMNVRLLVLNLWEDLLYASYAMKIERAMILDGEFHSLFTLPVFFFFFLRCWLTTLAKKDLRHVWSLFGDNSS